MIVNGTDLRQMRIDAEQNCFLQHWRSCSRTDAMMMLKH